ncbi:MAG: YHYH protein [Verrucomicrobiota bacterium]
MKLVLFLLLFSVPAFADPLLTSWFTSESTKYARVLTITDTSSTGRVTWTGQNSPVYAGVQEIAYDANYVYVRSYGLAGYVMGPWYNNAAHTNAFVNWPAARSNVWRFANSAAVAGTKQTTGLGAIGLYVNGVSMFDNTDGFVYSGGTEANQAGYWHRDAWVNEGATFDPGYAHQEQTGNYHYHAYPPALRYQLGDNVTISNGVYVEATGTLKHSPILAWVADGFPVYGPYGYSVSNNPNSTVRRIVSGFVPRNGQFGTDNLSANGTARSTIPAWAQRATGASANQAGPTVSAAYPFGRYLEDNDYLGDHGYVQGVDFDLNEWNARWCVTPEFPQGTWAYFCTLTSSNTPAFPYAIGRQFLGTPYTTTSTSIPAGTTNLFKGGPDTVETMKAISAATSDITLVWSSVEGGSYTIQASPDLTNSNNWSNIATNFIANAGTLTPVMETGGAANTKRFYRVARTGLATYWPTVNANAVINAGIASVTPTSVNRNNPVVLTITLDNSGGLIPPPTTVQPTAITLTRPGALSISPTNALNGSRNTTTGIITAYFNTISGTASTGVYTVTAAFGPNSWSITNGFTINP